MTAETSNARGEWMLERLRGVLEHGKMGDKCLIAPDLVTAAIAALSAQQSPAEAQPDHCTDHQRHVWGCRPCEEAAGKFNETAEAQGVVDEGSRSVAGQLLHWGGVPVHVTGTVTTSPGNWSLIDADLSAAQQQDGGGCSHEAWEENGGWCECVDCGYGWSARTAPPSTPVGVKTLSEFMAEQESLHPGIHDKVQAATDELRASLAQQPAADPRSTHRVWRGDDWQPCYCEATNDHRIGSEQPAAMDEAAVKRAVAAVMSAPAGISVETYVRIVLEAALTGEQ